MFETGALRRERVVGHAGILHRGEDEEAAMTRTLDDSGGPVRHLLFGGTAVHVDDTGAGIRFDAKE